MKWAWQIFEVCGRFVDVKVGMGGLWALGWAHQNFRSHSFDRVCGR